MSALDPKTAAPAPTASERARLEQLKARRASAPKPSAPVASDPAAVRLRTVRELYALGVRFIPLNGKVPRPGIAGWNRADYDHTLEQAEQWAREGNVGIIGGRLIVLDIDKQTPEVEALVAGLPSTVRARTGKGSHLYFLAPEGVRLGNSAGALPKGIDVRGAGGYVVAPGSIHPDTGRQYAWEAGCAPWEIDFAPLPESVVALIKGPKVRPSREGRPVIEKPVTPDEALKKDAALTPEQRERARRIVLGGLKKKQERVRTAPSHTSQNTYYAAVCDLANHHAGGLVTDDEFDEFLTALDKAAEERGVEGIDATRASGIRMGNSKPRYAHEIIAEKNAEEAEAERFVAGLSNRATTTDEAAKFRERRDAVISAINAALTEAVQAGRPEPLLRLREEWGWLARNDADSVRQLKAQIKATKADLGGFLLGDFTEYLKEVEREELSREREAKLDLLDAGEARPMIPVSSEPRERIEATVTAVLAWNDRQPRPVLYRRGSTLVMVGDDGVPAEVGPDQWGYILAQAARFYRHDEVEGVRIVEAPVRLLRDLVGASGLSARFPELASISHAPILTPNGALVEGGYDAETKTLVASRMRLSIPDEPTQDDARESVEFLSEHILGRGPQSGFPFGDDASRANALGLLLLPVVRDAIRGLVPGAVINAPDRSNGKTLFATCVMATATGSADTAYLPRDDRELQREILAPAFREGRRVLVLDNQVDLVRSPLLAKVLTDPQFAFRAYHTQSEIKGENKLLVILTGNNVQVETDFRRRTFWIHLDAKTPNADGRTGFRHADLHGWVRRNRAEVLSALFTIARAWYVAGQPEATVPTLGSYREWSRVIGGMLEFAGVRGFLRNLEQNRAADRSGEEVEEFLRFLAEQGFAGRTFTARDVCGLGFSPAESLSSHFRPQDIGDPRAVARRLGIVLLQVEGRRYGTEADCLWIARATDDRGRLLKDSRNTTLWLLHRERLAG